MPIAAVDNLWRLGLYLQMTPALTTRISSISYADHLDEPVRTRRLPGLASTLVLNLGDPFIVEDHLGRQTRIGTDEILFSGLNPTFCITEVDRSQIGEQATIPFESASILLGQGAMSGHLNVMGAGASPLRRALNERRSGADLSIIIETALQFGSPMSKELEISAQTLYLNPNKRISALAQELGWSRRRFSQRFSEAIGITPKIFARIARFELLLRQLSKDKAAPIMGELALHCGFYDQSHLANEVRAMSGMPLQQLVSERSA